MLTKMDQFPPYWTPEKAMKAKVHEEYSDQEDYQVDIIRSERLFGEDAFKDFSRETSYKVVAREFDRERVTVYRVRVLKYGRKDWAAQITDSEIRDDLDPWTDELG